MTAGTGQLPVPPIDRRAIRSEMDQARTALHRTLPHADAAELRRCSRGTRWTNQQLLFHMAFGYLIVRALLPLARLLSRVGTVFKAARVLPFASSAVASGRAMAALLCQDPPPVPSGSYVDYRMRVVIPSSRPREAAYQEAVLRGSRQLLPAVR